MAKAMVFIVASVAINGDLLFKAFVPLNGAYQATPVITLVGQGGSLGANPYSLYMPEIRQCFPEFEPSRENMGIVVSIVSSGDLGLLEPRNAPIKVKPTRLTDWETSSLKKHQARQTKVIAGTK